MKRWQRAIQDNYGTPTIELVSGKGSVVKDSNGNSYLDFLAGIATNVMGHAHPAIVKAVTKQIATLGHVSNFESSSVILGLKRMRQRSSSLVRQVSTKLLQRRILSTAARWAPSHSQVNHPNVILSSL
ncbi:MAG: hypothetical protein RIS49_445 [Actinomycetota bacterium]